MTPGPKMSAIPGSAYFDSPEGTNRQETWVGSAAGQRRLRRRESRLHDRRNTSAVCATGTTALAALTIWPMAATFSLATFTAHRLFESESR